MTTLLKRLPDFEIREDELLSQLPALGRGMALTLSATPLLTAPEVYAQLPALAGFED